jgi:hypothetical protein
MDAASAKVRAAEGLALLRRIVKIYGRNLLHEAGPRPYQAQRWTSLRHVTQRARLSPKTVCSVRIENLYSCSSQRGTRYVELNA